MCEATAAPAASTHSRRLEYAHDPRVVTQRGEREPATHPGEIREELWCRRRTHQGACAALVAVVLHRSNTAAEAAERGPPVALSSATHCARSPPIPADASITAVGIDLREPVHCHVLPTCSARKTAKHAKHAKMAKRSTPLAPHGQFAHHGFQSFFSPALQPQS